ncbi:hypothetical protein SmJEL517_g03442 [Synchytrium microbalum]|uniref:Uncharacterized protein n=1 Tax=Synchytrium microbalum TaxID=1806994 RepID=A0A507C882_9FUNG|nr:uncharacterized protein SmJEL517_g03442 [Synchytrium microbalum]TPX33705.1 hypothetical protein SmJEL517_g03442 [Synchytrium microbalum]
MIAARRLRSAASLLRHYCSCKTEWDDKFVGSVKFYNGQVLVGKGTSDWPADLEVSNDIKSKFPEKSTRFNFSDSPDGSITVLDGQVNPSTPHVVVCTHQSKDARCGKHGNEIYEMFKSMASENISLHKSSHFGGHKYAGNVIVYPPGDWYGLITSENAKDFWKTVMLDRKVLWKNWRGRMGLTQEQQRALHTSYQPNANTINISYRLRDDSIHQLKVPIGKKIMEVGVEHELNEGECGGNLECATCHVVLPKSYYDKLPAPSIAEEDMLEYAMGLSDTSRLSCQLVASPELEGCEFFIPQKKTAKPPPSSAYYNSSL